MQKLKNVTFSLPVEYINKLREYSNNKYIDSMNSGVKTALENLFKQIEKDKLYKTMQEASKDNMLLNDIEDISNAYRFADSDLSGGKDKWWIFNGIFLW